MYQDYRGAARLAAVVLVCAAVVWLGCRVARGAPVPTHLMKEPADPVVPGLVFRDGDEWMLVTHVERLKEMYAGPGVYARVVPLDLHPSPTDGYWVPVREVRRLARTGARPKRSSPCGTWGTRTRAR